MLDDCGELIDLNNHKFVDYGEECCNLLNEQHETIQRLKQNVDELLSVDIEEELLKENEELKQAYTQLKHRHSLLHDECIDAECDRDSYRKDIVSLEKENEQLKEQWKEKRHEDINELSVIAMKYKALEKENERLRKCINEIYTIARLEEVD